MVGKVRSVAAHALRLIYPASSCLLCDDASSILVDGVCVNCVSNMPHITEPICKLCGRPVNRDETICAWCERNTERRVVGRAPYTHERGAAALVHALKYNRYAQTRDFLAKAMLQYIPPETGVIVPVPLHNKRLRERGFNQARLLCDGLSSFTGKPVVDALIRVRGTGTQTRLAPDERARNVIGAFAINTRVRREQIAGVNVTLVDDVRTTGATLAECAKILLAHGAADVFCLTATLSVGQR